MNRQNQGTERRLLFNIKSISGSKEMSQQRQTSSAIISLAFLALLALGVLSVPTLTFSGKHLHSAIAASVHQTPTYRTPAPQTPTPQRVLSPTPSSTPPLSTQQRRPIEPFPTTLAAQIATLEAHDRYFSQGNPFLPEIALTFDDGPNPGYTEQILAILKKYRVKATFFDVGGLVQLYPKLVRQEIEDGHVVGNHTWTHADLPYLSLDDIKTQLQTTSDIIQKVTGARPTFMRPPYGDVSANVLTAINDYTLTGVQWNDAASDWLLPGASVIADRILNGAGNGAVVLLHDGGGDREQTVAALPTIIEQLLARHYRFVTVAEMAAHNMINMNRQPKTNLIRVLAPAVTPQAWQVADWSWVEGEPLVWREDRRIQIYQ